MAIVGRGLRIVLVLVLVVVLALTGLVAAITMRSLPTTSGSLHISALHAPATVIRDKYGIANIYADSPHDLFVAQGYVHAQERFWQMEVWRHISAGRLSELFGATSLDTDKFVRTLDWRGAAKRDLAALSRDARAALDDYATGVNAWLDVHRGSLGLPFVVTGVRSGTGGVGGYDPERWTALDSLAWQKVQAWDLGGNLGTEIFRMLADERLGDAARTNELFPAYRDDAPVITATTGTPATTAISAAPAQTAIALDPSASDGWRHVAAVSTDVLHEAGLDGGGGLAGDHGIGSNNWVVGPSKSTTGGALLANDPHLGIGMPSVWFINGLHCRKVSGDCPYDVTGVSFPGVPLVVLGHNARIAWGATNVDPDVQDLFVEKADPNDAASYLFRGHSVPFTVRREQIKVAGSKPVTLTVRETAHGPILNPVDDRLKDSPLLAFRWTATAETDGTFESIVRLNTAASYDDFRAALRGYGSPSQNFVYADVDGHIGYQMPGLIPIRGGGARGDRPVRGDDGRHEWEGYIPYADLPRAIDPRSDIIVTANNAPVDASYDHFLGAEWDSGDRAAEILERLKDLDDGGLTTAELRTIQTDTTIRRAALLVPKLRNVAPTTSDGRAVLDSIRAWNRECDVDSHGCAAYIAFELRLAGAIFDDELGPLARDYVGSDASLEATLGLLDQPSSPWWDDARTKDVHETLRDIVARALDRTGGELRAALGAPDTWRWGAIHRATFREQTLGSSGIAPLEWYLDKGPVEVGGAAGAVLNTYYDTSLAYPDPDDKDAKPAGIDHVFDVSTLPSFRLTVDMSALDDARIVQTTGQSGNPFDGHYGDMLEAWRTGQTVPLPFTAKAVEAAAAATLELRP
ncbi:MAG: penicillin acylase family protein [Chloroflexota bacterium]